MCQTGLLHPSHTVGVRKLMLMKSWPMYCVMPALSNASTGSSVADWSAFLFSPCTSYDIYTCTRVNIQNTYVRACRYIMHSLASSCTTLTWNIRGISLGSARYTSPATTERTWWILLHTTVIIWIKTNKFLHELTAVSNLQSVILLIVNRKKPKTS